MDNMVLELRKRINHYLLGKPTLVKKTVHCRCCGTALGESTVRISLATNGVWQESTFACAGCMRH